jgi:hypothetical protein
MVQSMASSAGDFVRQAVAERMAVAPAARLGGDGESAANRSRVGSDSPKRPAGPTVRARTLGKVDRSPIGLGIHVAIPRKTAQRTDLTLRFRII